MRDRKKYVCASCGSDDVVKDANAEWDVETQQWVLQDFFDTCYCNVCETEVFLKEIPLEDKS